mmetsp:Transcript_2527/g.5349  ORF Transcript_2527/g.5349 Transcript_2527/m.5349 type:complete len:220 (+) Transcript_2527:911-1570(+)
MINDWNKPCGKPGMLPTNSSHNAAVPKQFGACLSNTAFPAMSVGIVMRKTCHAGKFHGMMDKITPSGWYVTYDRLKPGKGVHSVSSRNDAPCLVYQSTRFAHFNTSALPWHGGFPISLHMSSAKSSAFALARSAARPTAATRSRTGTRRHSSNAALARLMMRSTSSGLISVYSSKISEVFGFICGNVVSSRARSPSRLVVHPGGRSAPLDMTDRSAIPP